MKESLDRYSSKVVKVERNCSGREVNTIFAFISHINTCNRSSRSEVKMPEVPEENGNTIRIEDLKILREWITKQPHLPQNIHDMMLQRFLHTCHYSIEKTKNLIDLFFTIRSQAPELFSNRDVAQKSIQNCFEAIDMVPLPKLTGKNYKLLLYRLADTDPEKFAYAESIKSFYMVSDVRMLIENEFPDGEVPIFDMAGMSLKHVTRIPLPIMKKYMVYSQEAHPIQLKEIHLINAPTFLDKLMALMRPFIKSEILSMIHTHLPNSTTLFEYVPKELLPLEYGGSIGKVADLKEMWIKRVVDNKDYITDESRWTLNESKRPTQNENKKQLFGVEGSFRSLSID